ncbi:MAG: hypothetical protein AAFU49_07345 [Pseudomonadota bacterium]
MATAREFLESSKIKGQIDALNAAATSADGVTKAVLSASGISHYPLPVVKKLKNVAIETQTAQVNFNLSIPRQPHIDHVTDLKGTGAEAKKLIQALDKHEALNANHQALIGANLAVALSAFFAVLNPFTKTAQRFKTIEQNLKAIRADLEKAKKAVKEAQAQAAINLALGSVTALISPAGVLARFGVVVAGATVGAVINECLGSKGVGPAGAALTGVQGTLKTTGVLSKPVSGVASKVFRSARAIIDMKEMAHAHKIATSIEKRMKTTEKDLAAAQKAYAQQSAQIAGALKASLAAHKKALAGVGKHKSLAAKRMPLVKALDAWKPA